MKYIIAKLIKTIFQNVCSKQFRKSHNPIYTLLRKNPINCHKGKQTHSPKLRLMENSRYILAERNCMATIFNRNPILVRNRNRYAISVE